MDPSQVGLVGSSPPAEGGAELSESPESRDTSIPAAVMRSFLWNLGAVLGIGLLLISGAQAARKAGNAGSPPEADETPAKVAPTGEPADLEARLEGARLSLDKQDYMAVWTETEYVLARSPGEPRALTYQSQVRLAMGQPDVALAMLERALDENPNLLQAHVYLGYVYLRTGQTPEAEATLAAAKGRFPAQTAMLDQGFAAMRAEVEKEGLLTPAGDGNPHSRLGAPGVAEGANPHATVNPHTLWHEEPFISGTLELDASLEGKVAPGSVVFLTVREAGLAAGPPLAAKRLLATSFPLFFEIGPADSMQGDSLPSDISREVLLEARVDGDGDAQTRDPSDPAARLDRIKAGASDLRLVLKLKQEKR